MVPRPHRIFVALAEQYGYARQVLLGIQRYARRAPRRWWFRRGQLDARAVERVLEWAPDGVIVQCARIELEEALLATDLPVVNISTSLSIYRLPTVGPDNVAAGALGAEHLWECGLRDFAFWPGGGPGFRGTRLRGFAETAARLGAALHTPPAQAASIHAREAQLIAWLQRLPKPVGIQTTGDGTAADICEACLAGGVHVPDEVAVVGMGGEVFEGELAPMPLSSVILPGERIGFEAMALLERLLAGAPPPTEAHLLPPVGIAMRASTRPLVIDDPHVQAITAYIHAHATPQLDLAAVATLAPLSRRALELRFRHQRGHTMRDEVHLACVLRAKSLLVETDLAVGAIAAAIGFADASHLVRVFRKHVGITPQAFRRQTRSS